MSKIEYYQKKPLVLRVVQYTGSDSSLAAIRHMNKRQQNIARYEDHLRIETLNNKGVMRADLGTFVVQGVKGEIYPVQPEIFAERYDPAKPDEEMLAMDEVAMSEAEGDD